MGLGSLLTFLLAASQSQRILFTSATNVDLTSSNRRAPITGLPDWSKVGFMQGSEPLPDDSRVTRTITPAILASQYGVVPNDGVDDTAGLQKAISDAASQSQKPNYTLLQLPAGVINLSYTIYVDSSYLIIRGAGNDPNNGGTQLVFKPNSDTVYDVLTANGNQWDQDGMNFTWSLPTGSGSATGGWLWPGRSIFRIGSKKIAPKFQPAAAIAPSNRVDIFYGTVNYHWRIDSGKNKGFMASQANDLAGTKGSTRVYIANATEYAWTAGTQVWVASPVRQDDYEKWGVTTSDYFTNSYVYQDWFTVTGTGKDSVKGSYIELDTPLRFDVYANSTSGGSVLMDDTVSFAKVMPIEDPIEHVGIENVYMTQPIDGLSPSDAERNYGNLAPEKAMHGVVFRYSKNSWVRDLKTFMTGSHPVATEAAKNIQVQDSYFDGAWNKGAGGNGYVRGSRVWDSLYFNLTQRNLRHFTFQWCAMGNVASFLNVTNDLNMHGGYEGYNLLELNYVAPAYSHRPGSCTVNCGGEGGGQEDGTWWPIYWSTGAKASKWAGATGPQNVFYRNYMIKQPQPNVDYVEYTPYFAKDGSLSPSIWQFGWDRTSQNGDHYQHLSPSTSCIEGSCLLQNWSGNEQVSFHLDPQLGVNGRRTDIHTSLFLKDVTSATTGVASYSSIAGTVACSTEITPKVVGYYSAASTSNTCIAVNPSSIDTSVYTHILVTYGNLASDGTVSVPSSLVSTLQAVAALKAQNSNLKVFLAIGGYGLGADSTAIKAVSTSSSARTKFGTTAKTVLTTYNLDGIDVEWATGITANQFTVMATAFKTGLGTSSLSLSTPSDFWSLSGVNKVTTAMAAAADFVSLITHSYSSTTDSPNTPANLRATLTLAQKAGFPTAQLLMGIPFYARSLGSSKTSQCVASGALGQGTYPYFAIDSIVNHGSFDTDSFQSNNIDAVTSTGRLTLSDGTLLIYDGPNAAKYKATLSQDLCMGGVSAFSIDQDNSAHSLTGALQGL